MNEPRIGDTIHYRSAAENPQCRAAIVLWTDRNDTVNLCAYSAEGTRATRLGIKPDPGHGWDDFTPGTWHHIH